MSSLLRAIRLHCVAMLCGLTVLAVIGCSPSEAPDADEKKTTKKTSSRASCEDRLANAWSQLRPSTVADLKSAVRQLNSWLSDCGEDELAKDADLSFLPQAMQDEASLARFSLKDGQYVRNCILFRVLADRAIESANSDEDRIVSAFYNAVRDIPLVSSEAWPGMSPYECLLMGRGTVEDRAWVFANVLRQMQIEVLVLKPKANDVKSWLLAAVIDKNVWLYSPHLGIPVPAADEDKATGLPLKAATLQQVLDAPELLADLGLDITADHLRDCEKLIIAAPSRWAPRMQVLENNLSADETVILFDEPTSDAMLGALADAHSDWKADSFALWDYPVERLRDYAFPSEDGVRVRQGVSDVMQFPFALDLVMGANGEPEVRVKDRKSEMLDARLKQLAGNTTDSTTAKYQTLRQFKLQKRISVPVNGNMVRANVPNDLLKASQGALLSALYFSGMCQYDRGEPLSAVDSLRAVVRADEPGVRQDAANYAIAAALAEHGEMKQALNAIQKTLHDGNAQRAGNAWLKKRWSGESKTAEPEATKPETAEKDDPKEDSEPAEKDGAKTNDDDASADAAPAESTEKKESENGSDEKEKPADATKEKGADETEPGGDKADDAGTAD